MTTELAVSESAPPVGRRVEGKQIAAGILGILALGIAALVTVGGALLAPLGIIVAWLIVRRRNRRLSRGASWIAAVAATAVALVALTTVLWTQLPADTLSQMQRAADSAQTHQPPPPAWLERIAPGSTARAQVRQGSVGKGAMIWFMVIGAGIGIGMLAGVVGTVGWLATLPLAYAITGRWIGSRPQDPPFAEA